MTRYLDPKNDVAFKKIFGQKDHKNLLISFLNSVLDLDGSKTIVDLTYLDPLQVPQIFEYKISIVDVLCVDQRGIRYIVEMQVAQTSGFAKRAQYYAAKAYSSQLSAGHKYPTLNQVIFLAIADHILFEDHPNYKSQHLILEKTTYNHHLKDLIFAFVELPKFKKKLDELETIEDKWLYFLQHAEQDKQVPLALSKTVVAEAYDVLEQFSWTPAELQHYMDAALAVVDYEQGIIAAEERAEKRGAKNRTIEFARKLLARGTPVDIIAEDTGLSVDEIVNLHKID